MAVKLNANSRLLLLTIFICYSFTSIARTDNDCVYTVYIRTGSIFKAGTDSIISLNLYDVYGQSVEITDLESWGGLMDAGYDYFERGNLDIFSGRGVCLTSSICAIDVISDGSGPHHGWYCNYVEVTATGVHAPCTQQTFTVEQWLALDTSPYKLNATINYCSSDFGGQRPQQVEEDLLEDEDCVINSPFSAASPVYSPPSAVSISALIGEEVGHSQLRRIRSSVLRKSYTSDDELEELSSPMETLFSTGFNSSFINVKQISNGNGVRYQLLREIWINSD